MNQLARIAVPCVKTTFNVAPVFQAAFNSIICIDTAMNTAPGIQQSTAPGIYTAMIAVPGNLRATCIKPFDFEPVLFYPTSLIALLLYHMKT